MLKSMSLKKKLMAGFITVAVITAIVGGMGTLEIKKIEKADTKLYGSINMRHSQLQKI